MVVPVRGTGLTVHASLRSHRQLAFRYAGPHARPVRHATQEDLNRVEALLAELRTLPGLRERKRGHFSRGSRAFLHFHEHAGDLYADVRLDVEFERMKVTSPGEQAAFLSSVRAALQPRSLAQGDAEVDHLQ